MKQLTKISLTLLLTFVCSVGVGQTNLVPNGSFEDTVQCPTTLADLSKTVSWTAPTFGSPDYFNSCTSNSNIDVPNNGFGSQAALTGNAYVGIQIYDTQSVFSYREYIQAQLQQTLISGQKYWVSFYVSLADLNDYAIQEFGAYFSPTQINDNSMDTTLSFIPQIEFSDSVITSKSDWTKISGSFTATGNEDYLIIGNFNRKQTTTAIQVSTTNTDYAYYYIDDVCVSTDSLTCANPVGITEPIIDNDSFNIYPNPATDFFSINNASNQSYNLTIYNPIGQLLSEETNIKSNSKKINITNFNSNLLFIKIKTENQSIIYKLLKP
ncbi:MAG: hypothetical protein A3K10_14770 [Bacteroidetes bacterium RIFCSPLOWO2_12_FULL_31_6]|nr:MAG: hypothetical protein A3K10_14770 [Bacteroidetes bacterium RIFCSPLOWO2_12_FULL_31_6]